jgi:hypothetical protein
MLPNCDDELCLLVLCSDSPLIIPLENVDIDKFLIMLFKVCGLLSDLNRSYTGSPNQKVILALQMLESSLGSTYLTLDEWKKALPESCGSTLEMAKVGIVENNATNWNVLFCFSIYCSCQVAVRLPIILMNWSEGITTLEDSYAIKESLKFAELNASILAAFMQHNPTSDHTSPMLGYITIYTAVPLMIASKITRITSDFQESSNVSNAILVHYSALSLYLKYCQLI